MFTNLYICKNQFSKSLAINSLLSVYYFTGKIVVLIGKIGKNVVNCHENNNATTQNRL